MKKIIYILLFVFSHGFLSAQTRFYITQILSPVTPVVNSNWNVTTGNSVLQINTYHDRQSASVTSSAVGGAAVRKVLIRQLVSPPLKAQTINGTVTGQIRLNISSITSRSGEGFVYFRIINEDGTIAQEVGSLTTTALTTTNTNRTLISLNLSNVIVTTGQRLCFDFGWNYSTGTVTTTTATAAFNSAAASDLPVDNTTATAARSWIEFSQTIYFQNKNINFF